MSDVKVICVYLQKGGPGKTTNTCNIAYELAKLGKTLIVDADHQGNATYMFAGTKFGDSPKCLRNVLSGERALSDAVVQIRKFEPEDSGLYILGTKFNDRDLTKYVEGDFRDNPYIINSVIDQAKDLGFKYVLFDLSPNYGFFERMVLSRANIIVPVVNLEDFAVQSLIEFQSELKKLKAQYRALFEPVRDLIINRYDPTNKVHNHWYGKLKASPYEIYEMRASKAITSSQSMHQTIQEYQANNKICDEISRLVEKIK